MKSISQYLGFGHHAVDERRDSQIRKVLQYLDTNQLSTIPGIVSKIDALARDQNAGVDKFVAIYQMDKSSSARLVRMANSALYYRDNHAVLGIRDAVLRVGFNTAREILHAASVCALYKAHMTVGTYSAIELWKHSMAVAIATRLIHDDLFAYDRSPIDPYLTGLLHDIGISIAHAALYHDGFAAAMIKCQEEQGSLLVQEQKLMGITHPEIGAELGYRWRFPDQLSDIIRCHHAPNEAPASIQPMLHALRTAEWMAFESGLGYTDITAAEQPSYHASRVAIGLDGEDRYNRLKDRQIEEFNLLDTLGWFSRLQVKT